MNLYNPPLSWAAASSIKARPDRADADGWPFALVEEEILEWCLNKNLLRSAKQLGSCVNQVQSNECSDESRRNSFEIATEFGHRHVTAQINFVNTFERP